MAIDPTFAVGGSEWQVGLQEAPAAGQEASGRGFGSMLADQIEQLSALQEDAAAASRSLADGTAGDPASIVMAVERARLAMQFASQIRAKAVEATQDIFHTQV